MKIDSNNMKSCLLSYHAILVRLFVCLLCLLSIQLSGQTVIWTLQPQPFDALSRFGPNLFLAEQGGHVGIIHCDGSVVVPIEADDIGSFYEHYALVTVREQVTRHRILGVLADDGTYTPFTQPFFTLDGQEFFSEGLLSVQDGEGRKGYIDCRGNAVCGFDQNYLRIKPFIDGYAAVSIIRGNFFLIDCHGQRRSMQLPDDVVGSKIVFTYNSYQGKVLVVDDNNHYYKYNLETGECQELGKNLYEKFRSTDYLFRPISLTHCGEDAPFVALTEGELGLSPVQQHGLYGFIQNGTTVLPCQLNNATSFEDGLSIVTIAGRKGILRQVSAQPSFSLHAENPMIEFTVGETVKCHFSIDVPLVWQDKPCDVSITGVDGAVEPLNTNGQYSYTIQSKPINSQTACYDVTFTAGGLCLYEGQVQYSLKRRVVDLVISDLVLDNDMTDDNRCVTGSVVVYNPNEVAIDAELKFSTSDYIEQITDYPSTISLAKGERRKVEFRVITAKRRGEWVYTIGVTTSRGGQETRKFKINTF